ncbi:MAG: hypothetical protein J2P37_00285 [Ktedonobacteraceae bacterium]|nr:hypothetical protein [Ktedonobacteraceae bacterium]
MPKEPARWSWNDHMESNEDGEFAPEFEREQMSNRGMRETVLPGLLKSNFRVTPMPEFEEEVRYHLTDDEADEYMRQYRARLSNW